MGIIFFVEKMYVVGLSRDVDKNHHNAIKYLLGYTVFLQNGAAEGDVIIYAGRRNASVLPARCGCNKKYLKGIAILITAI